MSCARTHVSHGGQVLSSEETQLLPHWVLVKDANVLAKQQDNV